MSEYYKNHQEVKNIYEYNNFNSIRCDEYKQKSDEMFMNAKCIKQEAKRLSCEAKELEQKAKELEMKAMELYAQSKIVWNKVCELEKEGDGLIDLATLYCQKTYECYKNSDDLCKTECIENKKDISHHCECMYTKKFNK